MRRRHWFEIHEQPWFPSFWRKMFQAGLGESQGFFGTFDNIVPRVSQLLHRTGTTEILDLCSGSAKVVVDLRDSLGPPLDEGAKPRIVLSDLFPNVEEFEKVKRAHPEAISYYPEPVDAFHPPADAPKTRSIVSALHHFRPADVRQILTDAALHADAIIVLESTRRTWANLFACLPLPLPAAIIGATRLRPWSPWHIVWNLLLPVIPLAAFWDGLVSSLRSYTVEELQEIVDSIEAPGFHWEIGTEPMARGSLRSLYLLGWREKS